MKANVRVVLSGAGTFLAEVAPEVRAALDKDGPGGRKITAREGLDIGLAVAEGAVKALAGPEDEAELAALLAQVRAMLDGVGSARAKKRAARTTGG